MTLHFAGVSTVNGSSTKHGRRFLHGLVAGDGIFVLWWMIAVLRLVER